jgi:hypothetical protein
MRRMPVIVCVIALVLVSGCSDFARPPKYILADGEEHYACRGIYVRTFKDGFLGGETYTAEFTNQLGEYVQLRGVKKLLVKDVQKIACQQLPAGWVIDLPYPRPDAEPN